MKDIKTLFLAAKNSGKQSDVTTYTEAVQELLESKPFDFLSNLEYIITSDIGLSRLNEFVEKWGLSIAAYDPIMECLQSCIEKCEQRRIDASLYQEQVKNLELTRNKYSNCFNIFGYYSEGFDSDKYLSTYYSLNEKGIQNNKLVAGMIKEFGEAAIADALITADTLGSNAVGQVLSYVKSINESRMVDQWLYEASSDIDISSASASDAMVGIKSACLSHYIESVRNDHNTYMREAMIMGNTDATYEYSEMDIDHIKQFIEYKEYLVTCAESSEKALALQKEVYSLYEEFADVLEEDTADSVIPMLPQSNGVRPEAIEEDMSWRNTRNKKTGEIPSYLSTNHNLGYGEDEPGNTNGEQDSEPSLDDFKRASASSDSGSSDVSTDDDVLDSDPEVKADITPEDKAAINNYYYYTYNNSMNKNTNSFNKDRHDDNSVDNSRKVDNHSIDNSIDNTRKTDDHSTGKHINSHNDNTDDHSSDKGDNRDNSIQNESALDMVKLDIGLGESHFFSEGVRDILKNGFNRIKGLFKRRTLGNLQNLDTPAMMTKSVPLTILGTDIPINGKKDSQYSAESTNFSSDLETLLESGYVITESVDGHISKDAIKEVVKKFKHKYNADILFLKKASPEIAATVGPASLVITDKKTIKRIDKGKYIDKLPSYLSGDEDANQRVIIVNSQIIRSFNISKKKDLMIILEHEYGHALTFDQLSELDWYEYFIKRNVIQGLVSSLYPVDMQAYAESNLAYYKLKPEKLANDKVGIDPNDLLFALLKRKGTGHLDKIDLDGIVQWNIPPNIIENNKRTMKGQQLSNDETIQGLQQTKDLYNKIITSVSDKSALISYIDGMIKTLDNKNWNEAVGDADGNKPESDHPVKDTLQDIDRTLVKTQQKAKKVIQDVQNTGRAAKKPFVRAKGWVTGIVNDWKDADENKVKEKMADPKARRNIFTAIAWAIKSGSILKAGLLLNPVFLFLSITKKVNKHSNEYRIRNEMIGELKTELEIIDEKIEDARRKGDDKAKYQLMRLRNEINKKLVRVSGSIANKKWTKKGNVI